VFLFILIIVFLLECRFRPVSDSPSDPTYPFSSQGDVFHGASFPSPLRFMVFVSAWRNQNSLLDGVVRAWLDGFQSLTWAVGMVVAERGPRSPERDGGGDPVGLLCCSFSGLLPHPPLHWAADSWARVSLSQPARLMYESHIG